MTQLFNLMIEVMLPLALLVVAGAVWPLVFRDTPVEAMRTQLNRLVKSQSNAVPSRRM